MNNSMTLGQAIESVHTEANQPLVSYYGLGVAIIGCHKLWKEQHDGTQDGEAFATFCERELGLSAAYCFYLADIVATFDEKDVEKIGVAKLGLLLKLPESERNAMLEDVRKGIMYTALAKRVKASEARVSCDTGH